MPWSVHSHSGEFCKHASGTLAGCVAAAHARGFELFGLSEHMPRYRSADLYPEEVQAGLTPDDLDATFTAYVAEARRLQKEYSGRMDVLVGCETEVCRPESLADVRRIVATHSLDYTVGSVHHVHEIPIDYDTAGVERAEAACGGTTEALFVTYFEQVAAMVEELRPTVVGHLDLVRLLRPQQPLTPVVRSAALLAIDAGVRHGCLFEINSSGLRKGLSGPYPHDDLLQVRWIEGGERKMRAMCQPVMETVEKELLQRKARLTVSDDSHCPEHVGVCYADLHARLIKAGVEELYRLRRTADGSVVPEAVPRATWINHPAWNLAK